MSGPQPVGPTGKRDQPGTRRATWVVLLIGVVLLAGLHLASIGPYWNISPDSATYVGVGRSLARGEGWGPPSGQPPVTSLVYAGILFLFPNGYVALNTVTQLLILTSLALAFVLLARRGGRTQALLVILLSLASTRLHYASTQLLSEPTYLFFSTAALLLLEPPPQRAGPSQTDTADRPDWGWLRESLAGALVVIAAMTRTIGITLPLAVLIVEGKALIDRQRKPKPVLIAFALLALLAVAWWDGGASGRSYVGGWFRMFFTNDPWSPTSGPLSPFRWVELLRDNIRLLPAVGGVLLNGWFPNREGLAVLVRGAGTLIFAWGVFLSLRQGITVMGLYVLLYVTVVAAHMLGIGAGNYRHLVPVVPLLFYYACEGARQLAVSVEQASVRHWPAQLLRAVGALYVIWYASLGTQAATREMRDSHSSPFGSFPIKRPENYDAQRIALWVRTHSRPNDRYASAQRDMYNVLTERQGYDLVAGRTSPPEEFVTWLDAQQIRYLFLDRRLAGVRDSLIAVISAYPDRFHPVLQLPGAMLYEVRPRRD